MNPSSTIEWQSRATKKFDSFLDFYYREKLKHCPLNVCFEQYTGPNRFEPAIQVNFRYNGTLYRYVAIKMEQKPTLPSLPNSVPCLTRERSSLGTRVSQSASKQTIFGPEVDLSKRRGSNPAKSCIIDLKFTKLQQVNINVIRRPCLHLTFSPNLMTCNVMIGEAFIRRVPNLKH